MAITLKKGKELKAITALNKEIIRVVAFGEVVWDSVGDCFSAGFWINEYPWNNESLWKNMPI